jgi:hypothetical protein
MGIYKFGNKYLPSAYKTQFEFRSHFLGGKSASYRPGNTVCKCRGRGCCSVCVTCSQYKMVNKAQKQNNVKCNILLSVLFTIAF